MSVSLETLRCSARSFLEVEQAEQELFCCDTTQRMIADNLAGDRPKYRVQVYMRMRDPQTGEVTNGWYRFGLIPRGDKAVTDFSPLGRQVIAFAFRWRVGLTPMMTPLYQAANGTFYESLGIQWGADMDYTPILDEAVG